MLALALVLCLVVGLLCIALVQRSIGSARVGTWSKEHLVARLLAESATEELFCAVQEASNDSSSQAFNTLRMHLPASDAYPIPVPALRLDALNSELTTAASDVGAPVRILPPPRGQSWVTITRMETVSEDPRERMGVLRFDVGIRVECSPGPVIERVVTEHSFMVSRDALPRFPHLTGPTRQPALLIGITEPTSLPGFHGLPALWLAAPDSCTRRDGSYRSLRDALSRRPPDGLTQVWAAVASDLATATLSVGPDAMARRAQYVTTSAVQLIRFLDSRRGHSPALPVTGVIHNSSTETIGLSFVSPPFSGRCVISSAGPLEVGDIKLDDPLRDDLILISAAKISVTGRSVEASLICSGPMADRVYFRQRAKVLGPIVSAHIFKSQGLSGNELGQCQIGTNPSRDCDSTSRSTQRAGTNYVTAFSPHPIRLEHHRE